MICAFASIGIGFTLSCLSPDNLVAFGGLLITTLRRPPLTLSTLSELEHRKLLRQAADTGIIIFFKQFIPFFWFRYWNTRLKLGSVVWVFFLLFVSAGAGNMEAESKFECIEGSASCDQSTQIFFGRLDLLLNTAAPTVFAVYSGYLARKARERLGIDRKTALQMLSKT